MPFMPEKRTASKLFDSSDTSPARKRARKEEESKESALALEQNPHHKYGHTVELLVGADKEVFIVHEATLKAAAPFFDVALTRAQEERQTKTLELFEDEAYVIEAFIEWAYTGSITVLPPNPDSISPPVAGLCIKLYIFANKVLATNLQNQVISGLWEKRHNIQGISAADSALAWPRSDSMKGLNEFILDWWALKTDRRQYTPENVAAAPDLMAELLKWTFESKWNRDENFCSRCFYHHHPDQQRCNL
ncbi:hypothetical protein KVT40_000424 [Elsinoe batatas]|uniref:BTB domain-containing protein n=1 Tax=Elsinoe batatas TaxID=2601811 RepID=A0A8K0LA30_9PEZI|nr:hypothetical protein KVT40_000424 [Elsinoe batatas]